MAKNIEKIAAGLGAEIMGQIPEVGGRAFGAARLARIIETMPSRLRPSLGLRPGRPTDSNWVLHPKVPMSDATKARLTRLAEQASADGRKVSPMQVAARILEKALASVPWTASLILVVASIAGCLDTRSIAQGIQEPPRMVESVVGRVPIGTPVDEAQRLMEVEGFKCSRETNASFLDRAGLDYVYCNRREGGIVQRRWQVAMVGLSRYSPAQV